jgi:CTP:molybdopterin cytidylyltransferase MocA
VIHPVDHPLVLASSIRALLRVFEQGKAEAALPSHAGKHGHPVAVSRRICEAIVADRFPAATLRDVLHAVARADVEVQDPGVVANCNTPGRLREALGRLEPEP